MKLEEENERLRAAFMEVYNWTKAYPLSTFPAPDLAKAAAVLAEHGMTLDAISAHAMRHVLDRVGEILRNALKEQTP